MLRPVRMQVERVRMHCDTVGKIWSVRHGEVLGENGIGRKELTSKVNQEVEKEMEVL